MTTQPHLSAPILFHPTTLKSNRALTSQITTLANEAFMRSHAPDREKWDLSRDRFPSEESYWDMLGEKGIVALIFDRDDGNSAQELNGANATGNNDENVNGEDRNWEGREKVIACAAALPWKGGWNKEGAGTEVGWEIKAVCVAGDKKYLKKGLAVQVMQALEDELVRNAKAQWRASAKREMSAEDARRGSVALWILAAECLNGAYWRKRGYEELRRSTEGSGTWGCKTSFELVVFRKEVKYEI
ncbi:hypothetical protein FB567DRAFT_515348 [Paraphoma chrysanthemicola]|uniref:Uncharacterized protein n=1 Tax=Paraphoma chrysanthemicola TaxID=798071 RepID=A0A8K0RI91_9PLEO|nr:hypothetical protein FB567DRAFT_515348 [Paraphoma chrysanthemicola]